MGLMQTCKDFGAKYGQFDIHYAVVGRKTVICEVASACDSVRARFAERLKDPIADGTVFLCIDMYTDDYRKKAYLDAHCSWVECDCNSHHAALASRQFGCAAHTAQNIHSEYAISAITSNHGSNVVAALKSGVRVICLHTMLESAWKDTRDKDAEAANYEEAISDLCRFAKQSTAIQEQLPLNCYSYIAEDAGLGRYPLAH